MKRYLLFQGESYYACGGWLDFSGSYDSLEDIPGRRSIDCDWYHVVDSENGKIIDYCNGDYCGVVDEKQD